MPPLSPGVAAQLTPSSRYAPVDWIRN